MRGTHAGAACFGVAATLVSAGCGPSAPARAPQPKVETSNLSPPRGVTLVQACTPTGPELCFNAVDDNCNGVIDEGCGVQTGLMQFTIAWASDRADVNLKLVTPEHETIPGDSSGSESAFHRDRDCPSADGCGGQNEENIFFDGGEPPRGHYVVTIKLVDLHGADAPVKVRFGARLGARVVGFDVDLTPGDEAEKTFAFDVP